MENEAVEDFKARWSRNGLGWFAEDQGDAPVDGYTYVFAYSGTSVYDTREMSAVIDSLLRECRELGIPTPYIEC